MGGAEPNACVDGEDHAARQLTVLAKRINYEISNSYSINNLRHLSNE